MRQGISRCLSASKGALAVTAALALSGCGGGSYVGSLFGSGSSSSAPASQPVASGQPPAAGAPQSAVLPVFQTGPRELVCPVVEVREGAAAHRVYAGGQSNANVRYQFSMGDIARECRVQGNQIVLKIGVEGRVLLGPAGSPGSFTVRFPSRSATKRHASMSRPETTGSRRVFRKARPTPNSPSCPTKSRFPSRGWLRTRISSSSLVSTAPRPRPETRRRAAGVRPRDACGLWNAAHRALTWRPQHLV